MTTVAVRRPLRPLSQSAQHRPLLLTQVQSSAEVVTSAVQVPPRAEQSVSSVLEVVTAPTRHDEGETTVVEVKAVLQTILPGHRPYWKSRFLPWNEARPPPEMT